MPPRLNLLAASRSLAVRTRPSIALRTPIHVRIAARRGYAEDKNPEKATGPNQDVLGHVSEEAADMGKITGETQPEIGQGTPVQEILERDQEGKDNAPEVIKEEINSPKNASDASAVAGPEDETISFDNLIALGQIEAIASGGRSRELTGPGHKFGVPALPIPARMHLHHRYDPVVEQVTNLIMKHGKLSVAQRNMSYILNHLRTSPPPVPSPARPLLPGAPPPTELPLDPVLYLTLAIDSVAPLLRIRSQKGAAGGGVAMQIPVPLGLRQRRRTAVQWILDAASKKKSRGSGRGLFAQRVAEEIVGVVEGRSSAWEKRALVHKTGTGARTNLNYSARRRF